MHGSLSEQSKRPIARPHLTESWRRALTDMGDIELGRYALRACPEGNAMRRYDLVSGLLRPAETRLAFEYSFTSLSAPAFGPLGMI